MESLLPSLQSSDVKVRTGAVEAVLERLQRNNRLPDVPVSNTVLISNGSIHYFLTKYTYRNRAM